MKAVVAAFNQEKALVGAFSVIVQLHRLIDLRHYPVVELRMLGIVFICVAARYHLIFIRRTTISSIPWKLFNSPTYKLAWKSGENLVKNIEMFPPYNESTYISC